MINEKKVTKILEESRSATITALITAQLTDTSDPREVIELAGTEFKDYKKKDLIHALMALSVSVVIDEIKAGAPSVVSVTVNGGKKVPMGKQGSC